MKRTKYYTFERAVSNIYFENLISQLSICFFPYLLLIDDFDQCFPRKELIIGPFVEWFPPTTMSSYKTLLSNFIST